MTLANNDQLDALKLSEAFKSVEGFVKIDTYGSEGNYYAYVKLVMTKYNNKIEADLKEKAAILALNGKIAVSKIEVNYGILLVTVLVRIPPAPPQQINPPRMKIPEAVSPAAMALLNALYDGADMRVLWSYRVPTPSINDDDMPAGWWAAYENELSENSDGQFFDGHRWMKFGVNQHILTSEEKVDRGEWADEDGIEIKVELNEAGREFVEKHRKAAQ